MSLVEWFKVIILGVVEGITEWLPISSTGHLILVNEFLKMEQSDAFMEMFDVVIQLGAIMAVVVLFWGKLWPFHSAKKAPEGGWFVYEAKNGFMKGFQNFCNKYCHMDIIALWVKIVVACLPAAIMGIKFDDYMDEHFYNPTVVAIALIVYGVIFIVLETFNARRRPKITSLEDMTFKTAILIGVFQILALIPGTSRSGSTIIGGILLGASREVAAEFTFFLGIPIMFGASLVKLIKFGFVFTGSELFVLLLGMAVAFGVSYFSLKFLMGYIKKHDFKVFGWYRIALGVLVLIYFFFIK
ncbi:MAG: undecaprenyl-diphosphate phosphatase [Lachnospiraceae bacterium]|jgi:undecaprenyl-diphosphatase|nr:undecaprenyl-diphosphate phosphatase [Lachnospiraceae bacterium]